MQEILLLGLQSQWLQQANMRQLRRREGLIRMRNDCGVCEKKVTIKNRVTYRWRMSGNMVAIHEGCEWQVIGDTRVIKEEKVNK